MIIVVEGISAAGKTTYTQAVAPDQCIPEFETLESPPDADAPVKEHARFWVEHNVRRFQTALEMEARCGFALCDTDPLKSHFDWCRAQAGFTSMELFKAEIPLIRLAIADHRLGFADLYWVKQVAPEVARAQKEGDPTRTRRRFDMHLALQPHLIDWFTALAEVLPGQVQLAWPDADAARSALATKTPEENPRRFDVHVWDDLIGRLPI